MLWYTEILIESALVIYLVMHRDRRPKFEALIVADFLTQLWQMMAQRMHLTGMATRVWYVGILIQAPLIALALREAADYRPMWHRQILFWWIALTFGCAWIRIFPYTGAVLLCINIAAFAGWLILAVRGKDIEYAIEAARKDNV